jgi:hypothetical protein
MNFSKKTGFNLLKKQAYVLLAGFLFTTNCYSQDLGNGFYDHGVTSPISNHRGTVSTTGENGQKVVLMWLMDHRGGYSLLKVNVETGKSRQFDVPFKFGDAPYASILSSKNKFYTLFNAHFVEFDPVKNEYTFEHASTPQAAMAMTEDTNGVIWAITYPKSGVVSYDPKTKEFKDYGSVYTQIWNQYPRYVARDKSGWIYFAIGNAYSQIVAFNPATGVSKPMLQEAERQRGISFVYLDLDGNVYGQAIGDKNGDWYEFIDGDRKNIGKERLQQPKPFNTGSQALFATNFPDGSVLKSVDLPEHKLTWLDAADKTTKTVKVEYASDGAWTMGAAATQDGKIAGGTSFPMRFFGFDPKTNTWTNPKALGQFNALGRMGDKFYFGVYPHGELLEWDMKKPWIDTRRGSKTNPEFLTTLTPIIHRPFRLLPYPSAHTIIMSGSPQYGYTGGGLLFWDVDKKQQVLLKDSAVILDQSSISLIDLPGNKFLGGTTTAPGTGGVKKATLAELYLMDINTKQVEWHATPIPGIQEYSDLCHGPRNLIYGIANKQQFFVFDPVKKAIVYRFDPQGIYGRSAGEQSPRIFIMGPDKQVYVLYEKAIVKIDPNTFKMDVVANSPIPINAGGDYLDGKIYFVSGSHLCSYTLK